MSDLAKAVSLARRIREAQKAKAEPVEEMPELEQVELDARPEEPLEDKMAERLKRIFASR